jgi:hypothetical protein
VAILALSAARADTPAKSPTPRPESPIAKKAPDAEKYTLRYKFQPGETLRWTVIHRNRDQNTYGGSTPTTESVTRTTLCWRVIEVDPKGSGLFETSREDYETRAQLTGQKPIHYNSKTDKTPPRGLEEAVSRIGKPLTRVKMDACGGMIERKPLLPDPPGAEKARLAVPLPKHPVAVGESWSRRDTVFIPLSNGTTKSILTQQVFTLKSVKSGVAVIDVVNEILTPIYSAEIEHKLIPHYARGTVRFDIDAGRMLWLQMDTDHQVIGFRGPDTSVHHQERRTEEFVPAEAAVAARPEEPKAK